MKAIAACSLEDCTWQVGTWVECVQLTQEDQHLISLLKLVISDALQRQLQVKRTGVQDTELRVLQKDVFIFFFPQLNINQLH